VSKIDHSLFSAHEQGLGQHLGDCPECGKALHIRNSKSGPFIGCSGYPSCHFSKPLHDNQTTVLKIIDGTVCPECGSPMAIKKGRYGMFIGCSNYPECHHIESATPQNDTLIECPQCKEGHLVDRTNKYGKRFFACNRYPTCRYVVNFQPVAQTCPLCGWGILINKKDQLSCPQPLCDYKQIP
jgi:putative DNA topoisomerase